MIRRGYIGKNIICLIWLLIGLWWSEAQGQIRLGAPSTDPVNSGAALEIKAGPYPDSTFKGLLLPKVALVNFATWSLAGKPTTGMLVYNTATTTGNYAVTPGMYSWYNFQWVRESPIYAITTLISAIDCQTNVAATGQYYTLSPLTASNTKQILVTPASAGNYYIYTNEFNGFSFGAQGNFTASQVGLPQSITLGTSGTPSISGVATFTVRAESQRCTFSLTVVSSADCSGPITGNLKAGKAVDSTLTKQISVTPKQAGTFVYKSDFASLSVSHNNHYSFGLSSKPVVFTPAQVGFPQTVILYGSYGNLPGDAGNYGADIIESTPGQTGSRTVCNLSITVSP